MVRRGARIVTAAMSEPLELGDESYVRTIRRGEAYDRRHPVRHRRLFIRPLPRTIRGWLLRRLYAICRWVESH